MPEAVYSREALKVTSILGIKKGSTARNTNARRKKMEVLHVLKPLVASGLRLARKILPALLHGNLLVFFVMVWYGHARVEYVLVKKVVNDKAIIVTRKGDIYLIEKGTGCSSLWRYEGKTVLVDSPGVFLGTGSMVLIPELGQRCRIRSSEHLGSSGLSMSPHGHGFRELMPTDRCENGHWIVSVSRDGSIIVLEDGSAWEVDTLDRINSTLWLPTEDVLVCNGVMINVNQGEKITVKRIR